MRSFRGKVSTVLTLPLKGHFPQVYTFLFLNSEEFAANGLKSAASESNEKLLRSDLNQYVCEVSENKNIHSFF